MTFPATSPERWSFAKDSVGPFRGEIQHKLRTFRCFQACGSARSEFNTLIGDIQTHLERTLSRAPTEELVVSLYMVGR